MTNKEAIDWLKDLRSYYDEEIDVCSDIQLSKDDLLYIDLAIKALEREETCENKDCGTEMIFECSVCGASTIDRMNWENGEFNYCPNCGRRVEK